MQTSEHRTGSKRIRIIGIIALFVAVFVLLNALLCFLIEPYRPSGYEMWEGFRSKTTLDTVYVGTSEAECGIDPAVVDSATGSSSYNMATNMQDLYCSFDAMRTAVEEKGITRVVLCLDTDISSMERKDNSRAEENYILARARTESASKGLKDRLSFAFSPEIIGTSASLTHWFPWIYNRSFDVKKNVTEKLSGAVSDPLGHRDENGFEPNDVVTENPGFVDREDAESFSTENDLTKPELTDSNRLLLSEILMYCRSHGVTLTVMALPAANVFNMYDYDAYLAWTKEIDDLCAAYGTHFYNCNLIDRNVLFVPYDEYKDVSHMNTKGAERFSAFLATFLEADPETAYSWFRYSRQQSADLF